MVVNRNLQVTVKKTGGMTMKTLEGMLSKVDANDGGERVSMSCWDGWQHAECRLLEECDFDQVC